VNKPIVCWEPFAPVRSLENDVYELKCANEALTEDNTSLCDLVAAQTLLLADANRRIAVLEQEVSRLERQGQYRITSQPETFKSSVRYLGQRTR